MDPVLNNNPGPTLVQKNGYEKCHLCGRQRPRHALFNPPNRAEFQCGDDIENCVKVHDDGKLGGAIAELAQVGAESLKKWAGGYEQGFQDAYFQALKDFGLE